MNIYNFIKQETLKALNLEENLLEVFAAETPKLETQGDVSLNLAMVLAGKLSKNPKVLAGEFSQKLANLPFVEKCEVAGAGFINLFLKKSFLLEALKESVNPNYGFANYGKREKINIEFTSANPTGPIHIGHTRGTIYGDVLSELLSKNGFDITREYYINDAGGQIETLLQSIFIRIKQLNGENVEIPDGCYPGEYLIPVAKKCLEKFGNSFESKKEEVREFVINEMMLQIKADLAKLGVIFDVYSSEAKLASKEKVFEVIEVLKSKNLLYKGIPEKPKGKASEDYEEREQLLFKSTEYGDSEDRAIQKSDGSNTYFSADIAYHKNKLERGFYKMIVVLGADHIGYVSRITAATKAISPQPEKTEISIKVCQVVKFVENGEPVKMSKRKGTFTTLADVIEEVSPDVLRFILLTKKNDSQMEFDLAKVKEQSKENQIFYIQYAFSRCSSILRQYKEDLFHVKHELLKEEIEVLIIKKILEYPKVMESAVKKLEPHIIANFLYELASLFHTFWNMGNEDHSLKFITEDAELTKARIFLIKAVKNVIFNSFSVFKIKPMEKM